MINLPHDVYLHILVSSQLTIISILLFGWRKALIIVFSIGLFKELLDCLGYGSPELKDLMSNTIGIIFGFFLLKILDIILKRVIIK